ncbi:hypothetical protein WA026_007687 [Henosepilachna vigintioctopunctata]|uniref:Uncharacterized protein n=1 Tax=Henosepilachna vigintioctopunctata TaxID=420089 RepID=A0AAW1TYF4_9CUCU
MDTSKLKSELMKLNKDVLIDIIITKCVPLKVSVSENLRNFVKNRCEECADELPDTCDDILHIENEVDQLKCSLRIANTEKKSLKRLVQELEKTTTYQETIISLLKGGAQKFEESLQAKTDVATTTEYSRAPTMFVQTPSTVRKSNIKMNSRGRQPTEGARPGRGRREVIQGNSQPSSSLSFDGAVKRAWLHIGRAKIGTQPHHIVDYLKSRFPDKTFTVEMLPKRDDALSVSFKFLSRSHSEFFHFAMYIQTSNVFHAVNLVSVRKRVDPPKTELNGEPLNRRRRRATIFSRDTEHGGNSNHRNLAREIATTPPPPIPITLLWKIPSVNIFPAMALEGQN